MLVLMMMMLLVLLLFLLLLDVVDVAAIVIVVVVATLVLYSGTKHGYGAQVARLTGNAAGVVPATIRDVDGGKAYIGG